MGQIVFSFISLIISVVNVFSDYFFVVQEPPKCLVVAMGFVLVYGRVHSVGIRLTDMSYKGLCLSFNRFSNFSQKYKKCVDAYAFGEGWGEE